MSGQIFNWVQWWKSVCQWNLWLVDIFSPRDDEKQPSPTEDLGRLLQSLHQAEWSTHFRGPRFVKSHYMIGGHTLKESIMGGIIILLTPASIIDPFSAWKPHLYHKDKAKGKKCPRKGALVVLSCVFMANESWRIPSADVWFYSPPTNDILWIQSCMTVPLPSRY